MVAGQKPVKLCWNKFTPTKTVNHTKYGCSQIVRITDNKTIKPANAVSALSEDMTTP
tara:strand:- start:9816 stop:9986 length:171 start_codon:yes stop_codon:yes gene_type:complete